MCAKLLRVNHVPKDFREPFISTGYRSCRSSFSDCLRSAFSLNNETLNFWTHLASFAYFTWLFTQWLWHEFRFDVDPFTYPLQVYLASVSLYTFVSSAAHLFNCMSERAHHICFFMDYAGISMYSLSCCIMYNVYVFPQSWIHSTFHAIYIPFTVGNSLLCTLLSCVARFVKWKALRVTAFTVQYLFCSLPLLYRCMFCDGDDYYPNAVQCHIYQFVLCLATLTVYATHFPEVLAPGTFDVFGHSHQIFHVLSSVANYYQLQGNILDMQHRREYLLSVAPMPTFANTAGILLVVLALNVAIIVTFSSMIWKKQHLRRVKSRQGIATIDWEVSNNNTFKNGKAQ